MTCRDVAKFLSAYLAGELTTRQRMRFEEHLAECPNCVRYLDAFRKTVATARLAYQPADESQPLQAPRELMQAILAARRAGAGIAPR